MSSQESGSIVIKLAGDQGVQYKLTYDEYATGNQLLCTATGDSTQSSVSQRFTDVLLSHYLVGMAFIDMIELNLGTRVIVEGSHPTEIAIRELLGLASGMTVVSGRDGQNEGTVDAFIGCDARRLVEAMPLLRRGGVAVMTCASDQDGRLDLYGTLHRKGLHFRSLNLGSDLVRNLPSLAARFERLLEVNSGFLDRLNNGQGSVVIA